ncbi:hypothetical protein VOLCADRAFT_79203 [Volvox carteri f. nagariensis]|uniref:DNA topoisomerase n=1 Tax=Volvox carteri f. nagariensis TaxID=3068 RepID=D8TJM6_VOLCA|nr:uncharacterized protein VOLCADRAFT_79203 [Volvox carteri f. nagariensis]EFJ52569.1 hypothetical protein VOLCADRAFT_79203 [Volvox carteri f. nagariensis]|eukprot:XP_002946642.1 hypothetical protein VOLCADRAFT_79203 [Volvox carteri f. nagariensis]
MALSVFMVAEKPSLAQSIAQILSDGRLSSRRAALDVHEFEGRFRGQPARFKMTSVIGHVYSIDFTAAFNSWDKVDPAQLYDAPTVKLEANPKAHVCEHLQREGRGCDVLVLWLDCDREGENICFEVGGWGVRREGKDEPSERQSVLRARFSAITAPEIRAAMSNLVLPNEAEALAVDARQELDLRVGVSFTRFQTRFFQARDGRYGNLDASVISYGPCQTPTLNFCVERHQAIVSFQPEPFWSVRPRASKAGTPLELEWDKGRVFDQDVGALFASLVREAKRLRVVDVVEKEDRKQRPHGLNTVELLKVASASLGMGPAHAMQIAERLYTAGYLSYPRTESSAYPPNFDITGTVAALRNHPVFGGYASALLQQGVKHPQGGTDVGDHPPITPVRAATEDDLGGGDAWRVYDFVTRHFLGSVSPDAVYRKTKATFEGDGETFSASGSVVVRQGFTAIMPWRATQSEPLPPLTPGEYLPLSDLELYQGRTSPPDYLTESDLIGLMEKHGIGTDASIPVHINNICERNYVTIQSGRRVVPTELGITLIRGYQLIDPELCKPQVGAGGEGRGGGQPAGVSMCEELNRDVEGKSSFPLSFVTSLGFSFSLDCFPLASVIRFVRTKCGKCRRYMKYISARPQRLYCNTCEEVLALPQARGGGCFFFPGLVRLYKSLVCPLDGYELLLFSLSGSDGKTYPLCPFCYNNPPFEGVLKVGGWGKGDGEGRKRKGAPGGKAGMPCSTCTHPTCPHSLASNGVFPCPNPGCSGGTVVLDPVSAPKWRLDCNRCNFLMYLPPNLHSAKVLPKETCEDCGGRLLDLDWKKGQLPPSLAAEAEGGSLVSGVCVVCDEEVAKLCEVKHGHAFAARRMGPRGRGGRGRGRRGRGRGRGRDKNYDPRMSFRDF